MANRTIADGAVIIDSARVRQDAECRAEAWRQRYPEWPPICVGNGGARWASKGGQWVVVVEVQS